MCPSIKGGRDTKREREREMGGKEGWRHRLIDRQGERESDKEGEE